MSRASMAKQDLIPKPHFLPFIMTMLWVPQRHWPGGGELDSLQPLPIGVDPRHLGKRPAKTFNFSLGSRSRSNVWTLLRGCVCEINQAHLYLWWVEREREVNVSSHGTLCNQMRMLSSYPAWPCFRATADPGCLSEKSAQGD